MEAWYNDLFTTIRHVNLRVNSCAKLSRKRESFRPLSPGNGREAEKVTQRQTLALAGGPSKKAKTPDDFEQRTLVIGR
jgi:hypothetical protein